VSKAFSRLRYTMFGFLRILKVGLSGLAFLLAYLAFKLIETESYGRRELVGVFMLFALLVLIVVATFSTTKR